jgi:hypothetical protein
MRGNPMVLGTDTLNLLVLDREVIGLKQIPVKFTKLGNLYG